METTILDEVKVLEELTGNVTSPCVSVIIPTHKTTPDRILDELVVNKILNKTKKLIIDKYGKNNGGEEIINKLNELAQNIDYLHSDEGVGFFVSPDVSHLVKFPFPVSEKVMVGDSFDIRDMIYLTETLASYYILLINEKDIKLFEGNGEVLKLIKNDDFPMSFVDDYEYARAALGSSYGYSLKSTEKDKSIVKEQRLTAYLKNADHKLSKYVADNTPLIISGSSKDLGYFKKIATNYKNVVGKISGNYSHENIQKLGELSFEKIKEHLSLEEDKILKRLNDSIGKKLALTGILDVWKAAKEGKGLILLVEKDYAIPGFVTKNNPDLFLHPPLADHVILRDAVEDVIETVIEKKGRVIIVENGKLRDFEGISMILRYW